MTRKFISLAIISALVSTLFAYVPLTVSGAEGEINPYAAFMNLPPNQFKPESLLALNESDYNGEYYYDRDGFMDSAWFSVGVMVRDLRYFDVLLIGDCYEYGGTARIVYADGTVVDGTREVFTDGERITLVFDQSKIGMRYAYVVSVKTVRGNAYGTKLKAINGYWDAGYETIYIGPAAFSPYVPIRTGGNGSIEGVYYTKDGDYFHIYLPPPANLPEQASPPPASNESLEPVSFNEAAVTVREIASGLEYDTLGSFQNISGPGGEIIGFSSGLIAAEKDGKMGYIDKMGNVIIPLKYDMAATFSEGFAVVEQNERFGYINTSGEVVVPPTYNAAFPFSEGLAAVRTGGLDGKIGAGIYLSGRTGFIDNTGKVVIPLSYDMASGFNGGYSSVFVTVQL